MQKCAQFFLLFGFVYAVVLGDSSWPMMDGDPEQSCRTTSVLSRQPNSQAWNITKSSNDQNQWFSQGTGITTSADGSMFLTSTHVSEQHLFCRIYLCFIFEVDVSDTIFHRVISQKLVWMDKLDGNSKCPQLALSLATLSTFPLVLCVSLCHPALPKRGLSPLQTMSNSCTQPHFIV